EVGGVKDAAGPAPDYGRAARAIAWWSDCPPCVGAPEYRRSGAQRAEPQRHAAVRRVPEYALPGYFPLELWLVPAAAVPGAMALVGIVFSSPWCSSSFLSEID